jgi:hypothetical protein
MRGLGMPFRWLPGLACLSLPHLWKMKVWQDIALKSCNLRAYNLGFSGPSGLFIEFYRSPSQSFLAQSY